MESTDTSLPVIRPAVYLVPDEVRVRSEDFGLLFYDTRSTTLTFVRSGDGLEAAPFTGERRVLNVVESDENRRATIERLLKSLLAKGLIVVDESD